ncbi:hypothetical protein ElyMa_002171200 [Elysia marginata]|uniref:Uncharacterized protein n=1 Tax=Elysia marginata TaxID=1093978 RepID=A0AAV4FN82_9GAST|nr:hypothetical protein ElyMa_002171200 [Elysia marginata]
MHPVPAEAAVAVTRLIYDLQAHPARWATTPVMGSQGQYALQGWKLNWRQHNAVSDISHITSKLTGTLKIQNNQPTNMLVYHEKGKFSN